mgnify:CR=1 FL=1|tara:strand:- start:3201 stop:4151 length:951 start_codon:yes stop_codon:yes gene_type:complete
MNDNVDLNNYTIWPVLILTLLALYNISLGIFVFFNPYHFPFYIDYNESNVSLFLYAGALIVFGIGYLFSVINPIRFWPIIAMGLVFNVVMVFTVLGYLFCFDSQLEYRYLLLAMYGVWIFPLVFILKLIYSLKFSNEFFDVPTFEESLHLFQTQDGKTLFEINNEQPTLVVCLRHFGCVFCKMLLSTIDKHYDELSSKNVSLVLVHMVDNERAKKQLQSYKFLACHTIADPRRELYRSFGLSRGRLYQLFSFRVLWKTFLISIFGKCRVGNVLGDVYQMSGMFLLYQNKVLNSFVPEYISDEVDLLEFIHSIKGTS